MSEQEEAKIMASSEDDAPKNNIISITPNVVGTGNERVLSTEDFDELNKLLSSEQAMVMESGRTLVELEMVQKKASELASSVLEARAKRDKFCVELEEKYYVPKGLRWHFDYGKKAIIISRKLQTDS